MDYGNPERIVCLGSLWSFWFGGVGAGAVFSGAVVLLGDVRLIDGTGAKPREHVSLLIRDGRIEKIGKDGMPAPIGFPGFRSIVSWS